MIVRKALPAEVTSLGEIERDAGERFREVGMPEIADDPPAPIEALAASALILVAWAESLHEDGGRTPTALVGYAWVEIVDGQAHLEQLSVGPGHNGRGIGSALIEAVVEWATAQGHGALTLTTFREVPFNAPFYARRGFVAIPASEWNPGMTALVEQETAHGLDQVLRVVMARSLGG